MSGTVTGDGSVDVSALVTADFIEGDATILLPLRLPIEGEPDHWQELTWRDVRVHENFKPVEVRAATVEESRGRGTHVKYHLRPTRDVSGATVLLTMRAKLHGAAHGDEVNMPVASGEDGRLLPGTVHGIRPGPVVSATCPLETALRPADCGPAPRLKEKEVLQELERRAQPQSPVAATVHFQPGMVTIDPRHLVPRERWGTAPLQPCGCPRSPSSGRCWAAACSCGASVAAGESARPRYLDVGHGGELGTRSRDVHVLPGCEVQILLKLPPERAT